MTLRKREYIIDGHPPIGNGEKVKQFEEGRLEERTIYSLKLKQQHGQDLPFTGHLNVYIQFFFRKIPPALRAVRGGMHSTYPSLGDLTKFALELMKNGIIKDQKNICLLVCTKQYSKESKTCITIEEIKSE